MLSLLLRSCAPDVDPGTAAALVRVESAANPYAIGVVGGVLRHQPSDRMEALATARALLAGGWNFSAGLAQINVANFRRLGLTLESAFDPCPNLQAMQAVLLDCFGRAMQRTRDASRAVRDALSCYVSGNFADGYRTGYVRRVLRAAASAPLDPQAAPGIKEIP